MQRRSGTGSYSFIKLLGTPYHRRRFRRVLETSLEQLFLVEEIHAVFCAVPSYSYAKISTRRRLGQRYVGYP